MSRGKTSYNTFLTNPRAAVITVIITGIFSVVVFMYLYEDTPPIPVDCPADKNTITFPKTAIQTNEPLAVMINVDNPNGRPLRYVWEAVRGQVSPAVATPNPQATYTAPADPGRDTILVNIQMEGCPAVKSTRQIDVFSPNTTSTPPPTPTLTSITDKPNTELTFVQFDYDLRPVFPQDTEGHIRLYICVESKWYRIRSVDLEPVPQELVNKAYQTDPNKKCVAKTPAVNVSVNAPLEISIGTGSTEAETLENIRVYRIMRTPSGLSGNFVRNESLNLIPLDVTSTANP